MSISKTDLKIKYAYLLGTEDNSGKKEVLGWTREKDVSEAWDQQSKYNLSTKIPYKKLKEKASDAFMRDPAYYMPSNHQFIPPLVFINSDTETEFLEMFYNYFDTTSEFINEFLNTIPALKFSKSELTQMGELLFLLAKITKIIESGDQDFWDDEAEEEYPGEEYYMDIVDLYDFHMGYKYWLNSHQYPYVNDFKYSDTTRLMRKVLEDAKEIKKKLRKDRHR